MTHAALVERADRWLRGSMGCGVALTELTAYVTTGEIPDAIGFKGGGVSILVECKTSRADFKADAKKHFRHFPEQGMGDFRFYLCEPGVLATFDMPIGWGLLYVHEKRIQMVGGVNPRNHTGPPPFTGHKRNEITLCVSALRRVGYKAVREACHPAGKD